MDLLGFYHETDSGQATQAEGVQRYEHFQGIHEDETAAHFGDELIDRIKSIMP